MKNKCYTPSVEELLSVLIENDPIYSLDKDKGLVEFRGKLNVEDTIHSFIEMNNAKVIMDDNEEPVYFYSINPNLYLLKYLDKEDIESFGYIQVENDPTKHKWISTQYFRLGDCSVELLPYIETIPEQLRGCVNVITNLMYGGHIVFLGKIKNKSEFKKLLKQLEIYEETELS